MLDEVSMQAMRGLQLGVAPVSEPDSEAAPQARDPEAEEHHRENEKCGDHWRDCDDRRVCGHREFVPRRTTEPCTILAEYRQTQKGEAPDPFRRSERDPGPRLVGAAGFEPASTCTPTGPGSRATIIKFPQLCGILRIIAPPDRPRIARIHHDSQRFCYQFATADRAPPHGPPSRAAAGRLHRDGLQMGRPGCAPSRPHRERCPRSASGPDHLPRRPPGASRAPRQISHGHRGARVNRQVRQNGFCPLVPRLPSCAGSGAEPHVAENSGLAV